MKKFFAPIIFLAPSSYVWIYFCFNYCHIKKCRKAPASGPDTALPCHTQCPKFQLLFTSCPFSDTNLSIFNTKKILAFKIMNLLIYRMCVANFYWQWCYCFIYTAIKEQYTALIIVFCCLRTLMLLSPYKHPPYFLLISFNPG